MPPEGLTPEERAKKQRESMRKINASYKKIRDEVERRAEERRRALQKLEKVK